MQLIKSVFLGLSALATLAAAQGQLGFTSVPSSVTAGQPATVTFSNGDNSVSARTHLWSSLHPTNPRVQPVTIILRQGDPNNLSTITTLTSMWRPATAGWLGDAADTFDLSSFGYRWNLHLDPR